MPQTATMTEQTKITPTITNHGEKENTNCFVELYDCINQLSMYDGLVPENDIATRVALDKLKFSIVDKVLDRCKRENSDKLNNHTKDMTENNIAWNKNNKEMTEPLKERPRKYMCKPKDWLRFLQKPPIQNKPKFKDVKQVSCERLSRNIEENLENSENFTLVENILECFLRGRLKGDDAKFTEKDFNLYEEIETIVAKFNPRDKCEAKCAHYKDWKDFIQKHVDACVKAEKKSRKRKLRKSIEEDQKEFKFPDEVKF
ncbi:hypothetical protein WDU94_006541 [Cyamophila willieti]